MKSIAIGKDGSIKKVEIPVPEIDETSMLCKVLACGICGTDRKVLHGTFKGVKNYPVLLGHEAVAEVVEVGKHVKNFREGDYVICPYLDNNPEGYFTGMGGFSEYTVAHDWKAMEESGCGAGTQKYKDYYQIQKKIPKDFDPVDAVMIITLREVLAACRHFGFKRGESIVVFGAGTVGLSYLKILKILGLGPIISIDIVDEKKTDAEKAGADYYFNSTKCNIMNEIKSRCPLGVNYVLDAVGLNSAINIGMELIKDNGKLLVYGISQKNSMELDWEKAPFNWHLQFFQYPDKFQEAMAHEQIIDWVREGVIDSKEFISDIFSFDEIDEAFKVFESGKSLKKIVIKM